MWTDTSRYSRSDKDRVPHEWTAVLEHVDGVSVRLVVHEHRDEPGFWFVSVHGLSLRYRLKASTPEEARVEAKITVEKVFSQLLDSVSRVSAEGNVQ